MYHVAGISTVQQLYGAGMAGMRGSLEKIWRCSFFLEGSPRAYPRGGVPMSAPYQGCAYVVMDRECSLGGIHVLAVEGWHLVVRGCVGIWDKNAACGVHLQDSWELRH